MIAVDQLAEVFVEIADTLVDDFDVIEFFELVTSRAASISNGSSAGLLLADALGQLQFMAASQESVKLLELFQLQNDEGPCLDCFHTGSAVVNTDLDHAASRWPVFAARAVSAGFRSVHAIPLRHRRDVIGALNLFSTGTGQLEPGDVRIIQALADIATIGLLQERSIHDHEIVTEQLQGALNSRITIEQAKGALARTHAITVDAAFKLLRDYARRHHHHLSDVALAVVTDPAAYPELSTPRTLAPGNTAPRSLAALQPKARVTGPPLPRTVVPPSPLGFTRRLGPSGRQPQEELTPRKVAGEG